MKNLPTLGNDSSFVTQFSFEDEGNFAVYDKGCRNVELQESVPGMRSAEYQTTIPLKFLIIVHNYANKPANVWTIKITTRFSGRDVTGRTLLRGENDSK